MTVQEFDCHLIQVECNVEFFNVKYRPPMINFITFIFIDSFFISTFNVQRNVIYLLENIILAQSEFLDFTLFLNLSRYILGLSSQSICSIMPLNLV